MPKNFIVNATTNLNGISIAYVMGVMNAMLACGIAFGVHLTDIQVGALATLVNAALILAVHVGHRVGEATANGSSTQASRERSPETGSVQT